ncbi:MAG: two-component system chemotaxis response regulator CheY [Pirellulaceae bacterium]|jgi:two-component system chemotaxis response regulator CheY
MIFLIVDDSEAMRMLIIRALRKAGFEDIQYAEAVDGVEALEMVRKLDPDLIITDWNMPEMDGLELLEKLEDEGLDNPLGFVTSECTQEIRNLAFAAGASFFISKPFSAEDFEEKLGALMI